MKPTLTLVAVVLASTYSLGFAQDAEDSLDRCRDLSIESFMQQLLTGRTQIVTSSLNQFCDDYRRLQEGVQSLREQVDDLRNQMPPADAILLVDDSDGCPSGWRDVAANEPAVFAGRMALAATGGGPYKYRSTGGESEHLLTIDEMPSHSHGVGTLSVSPSGNFIHNTTSGSPLGSGTPSALYDPGPAHTGPANFGRHDHAISGQVGDTGSNAAHNNMPPFVAMYFCKREG